MRFQLHQLETWMDSAYWATIRWKSKLTQMQKALYAEAERIKNACLQAAWTPTRVFNLEKISAAVPTGLASVKRATGRPAGKQDATASEFERFFEAFITIPVGVFSGGHRFFVATAEFLVPWPFPKYPAKPFPGRGKNEIITTAGQPGAGDYLSFTGMAGPSHLPGRH